MRVSFYIGSKGESVVERPGELSDLETRVDEMAFVFWDRDVASAGVAVEREIRFVCCDGVWRAFGDESGTFIAEWKPAQEGWHPPLELEPYWSIVKPQKAVDAERVRNWQGGGSYLGPGSW